MALGSIFGGFWAEVGGQVMAKFAQKSEEMGCQDDVRKTTKKSYAVFRPKKATRRIDKIAVPLIFGGGVPPYKDLRSNLRSTICRHAGCILHCKIAMIGDINLRI